MVLNTVLCKKLVLKQYSKITLMCDTRIPLYTMYKIKISSEINCI